MRYPFNGTYRLNQGFGEHPENYKQYGLAGHNGLDFNLPTGTPVVAATSGTVTLSSYDASGFGNYVEVTGSDYKTIYAHLDHAVVVSGQTVSEGREIGLSDNTGNSTGPHLHFGVKPANNPDKNNGYFGAIDPQPILDNTNQGELTMTPEVKAVLEDLKQHILVVDAKIEDLKKHVINLENK